jgi:hypothetical protein
LDKNADPGVGDPHDRNPVFDTAKHGQRQMNDRGGTFTVTDYVKLYQKR